MGPEEKYQNMFMRLNGEPPQERDFSGTENAMRMQMARVKAQIINNAMLSGVSENPKDPRLACQRACCGTPT